MKTKRPEQESVDAWIDEMWGWTDAYGGNGFLSAGEREAAWSKTLIEAVSGTFDTIETLRGLVRSPLEELFLATYWSRQGWGGLWRRAICNGAVVAETQKQPYESLHTVEPQARIGEYAADFLLTKEDEQVPGFVARVAVEIDGHDFHEKTKAQAAHDKKRDRFFTTRGISFLRFTGSEVHRDPVGAVDEVLRFLSDRFYEAAVAADGKK